MFLHILLSFVTLLSIILRLGQRSPIGSASPMRLVTMNRAGVSFQTDPVAPVSNTIKEAPVKVPILMYHYVEVVKDPKDTIRRGLDILPYTFDAQIQSLLSHGYTPVFMKDLADYLDGKGRLPDKPIVLTFDDGYRDFYTDAYPILQKYHVKATSYVIPGFLDAPNYMTKQQVKEVAGSGLVEVAAHTVHHVNLKSVRGTQLAAEITVSKTALEQLIGRPVTDFAYPYGIFDAAAVSQVAQAGFRTAVDTLPGAIQSQENRFTLRRLRAGGRVGDALISWLESVKT